MKLPANWLDPILCAALTVAGLTGSVWMYFLIILDDPNLRIKRAFEVMWSMVAF